jgi:hypothetical protein
MLNQPWWKRPVVMALLVILAVAVGAWLALDRPLPEGWMGEDGAPEVRLPEFLRKSEPDRLFCAESPDTGVCRCITTSGERPEISEEECRRRARASATE